jgi:hypothetical protein
MNTDPKHWFRFRNTVKKTCVLCPSACLGALVAAGAGPEPALRPPHQRPEFVFIYVLPILKKPDLKLIILLNDSKPSMSTFLQMLSQRVR